jgi:hypothetical protein
MTEEQRSELMAIAAQMALCQNMPPHCIGDWDIPAPKSAKACREIARVSQASHDQCKAWSKRIVALVDGAK